MQNFPSSPRPKGSRRRARRGVAVLSAVVCLVALAACSPDHVAAGTILNPGDQLMSSNGYHADMQTDGNFVVYSPSKTALWSTKTYGHPGAHLEVQTDGNVVVYSTSHSALWNSHTASTESVPSTLYMQTDGNLVLYAGSVALWSSNGGNKNCYGSGCQVLSHFESHDGGSTSRDCGYSQPYGTAGQSFWLFCDTPGRTANGTPIKANGSSYATGPYNPSIAPQDLQDPPSGIPEMLLPQPTGLTKLNGSPCPAVPGGSSYSASWATGLTVIPGTTDQLLIPFDNYCVEPDPNGGHFNQMTYFGFGVAEYNTSTGNLSYHQNVMTGSSYLHHLGNPTFDAASNTLSFFINCKPFQCATNGVYVARVALGSNPVTTKPWDLAQNYEYWTGSAWSSNASSAARVSPQGLTNWEATVHRFPNLGDQYVMVAMTDFSGGYEVLTSTSPTGPWTQHSTGSMSDCPAYVQGHPYCYAYNLHPELSTSTKLAVTVYNPRVSNVNLEMIPW